MLDVTYASYDSAVAIAPQTSYRKEIEALELLLDQVVQDKVCSTKVLDRETKKQIMRSLVMRMRNLSWIRRLPVSLMDNGDSIYC